MDGLMLDSEKAYYNCALKCSEVFGYGVSEELVLKTMGNNSQETERRFKEDMGDDFPFRTFMERVWQIQLEYMKSNPIEKKKGLDELLDYLEENKIKKAVATSTRKVIAEGFLGGAGIRDRFDYIVFGDDLKESKPKPEIYLKAIRPFDIPKEKIIAFEDSANGIMSAYNAGLRIIHIPDLAYVSDEARSKCDYILNDLNEAIETIEELNR